MEMKWVQSAVTGLSGESLDPNHFMAYGVPSPYLSLNPGLYISKNL